MATGSLKIKLRPLRLAFLVRPSDKAAIATAIETTSFLWGGAFNPIIPVYHKLPRFWGRDSRRGITARSVLDGYLDAFDPDYVVKVGELESEELKFGHREVVTPLQPSQGLPVIGDSKSNETIPAPFPVAMRQVPWR
jgi:hypothetical protein